MAVCKICTKTGRPRTMAEHYRKTGHGWDATEDEM